MRRALFMAVILAGGWAAAASSAQATEKLYFALEVRQEGKLIASPKLLGEVGKSVRAERRQPGASMPDYRLALLPTFVPQSTSKFDISLEVATLSAHGSGHVVLQHGEQRKVDLGGTAGELQVSLLVMKVNSPEFKALMDLVAVEETTRRATSI